MESTLGPRVILIGVTGSGKTTTALRLSRILHIPHVELDGLNWLPNWTQVETETFRQLVARALDGPAWVADGNYSKARDVIWPRATHLVWLDYSLPVILWQLTYRTLRRIIVREELWNGNHETLRGTFFSKDSLFLWALNTYPRYKRQFPLILANPDYNHLQLIHLRSRKETGCWLEEVRKNRKI